MSTQQTIAVPAGAGNERLSWFTRISYALGDTATNIVAGAMTILTFFYTDYAGVAPTTVGLVMLLSRIFDGMSDLLMGVHRGANEFTLGQVVPVGALVERAVLYLDRPHLYGAAGFGYAPIRISVHYL